MDVEQTLFNVPVRDAEIKDKDVSLTPLWMIQAMGKFDLDCCGIESHKTAYKIIMPPRDGLQEKWTGRVWCNPPYSEPYKWMQKMAAHGSGVALTLASTGTDWFQSFNFNASGILFLGSRPKFKRMDGTPFPIMRDCCLTAFSKEDLQLIKQSKIVGKIIEL